MSRTEIVLLHLANALVVATGVVYAVMLYLLEPAQEWAVVNHPWQPHVQHLHVLVAPALIFAVGLIWSAHVMPKLPACEKTTNSQNPGFLQEAYYFAFLAAWRFIFLC